MKLNNITSFILSGYWICETHPTNYRQAFSLNKNVLHTTFKSSSLVIYSDGDTYLQMIDDIFVAEGIASLRINGNEVTSKEFRNPDVQCLLSFPELIPVYRHFCDTVL